MLIEIVCLVDNFDTQATVFPVYVLLSCISNSKHRKTINDYWFPRTVSEKAVSLIFLEFKPLKSPSFCPTFPSCLGSELSAILRRNPEFIRKLCLCLESDMKFIRNWRHLASILHVDLDVIRRLGQYGDISPTIRLFDYLATSKPDLTIKELKDILLKIGRNDLISLLVTKGISQNN